jgi:hypothetical protein
MLAPVVEICVRQLQPPEGGIARQAAELLIVIAQERPQLLREQWETIGTLICHTDRTSHADSGRCALGDDHSDHSDRGPPTFRGITFPHVPRDF